MGRVWLAEHDSSKISVAIKVLHGHATKDPNFLESFRAEVRAAAALDHPGIVMVLDHGEVSREAAGPDFVEGSPWIAMELASGGTLSHLKGALPWEALRAILLAILEALAHAHARGVIHRDLKPSNILIATAKDLRPGLKLTDLGIAHALDTEHTGPQEAMVLGTPMFMAPEQVRGEWRDHGPWTDLYALGCVAYLLSSGTTPFQRDRPGHAIMIDHLRTEPRPFKAASRVPDGFAVWLSTLMAKNRYHRFETAPDAAAALVALGTIDPGPASDFGIDPTRDAAVDATKVSLGETWRAVLETPPAPRPVLQVGTPPPTAPFPHSWHRALPPPPSMQLVDAGISLYGLRSIPMVGREEERDRLWGALEAVHSSGTGRMVVIRGAAGAGKSRLAQWICERALETGAAAVTRARFGPELQPGQGIRDLGNRYLRTHDMPRDALSLRVREWMHAQGGSTDEAQVLTELLSPAPATEQGAVRLTRPLEYHAGVARVFQRMARRRPVIVWLDDVHWGFHGLGLARYILESQDSHPTPILVLATVRDDALPGRPDESRRLARISEHPRTETLALEAMPPRLHQRFIEELLHLDGTVAEQVAERTAGNPLFAVQLVGDWVQQGLLEPGPDGFQLAPGPTPPLPDDLHEVWGSRLESLLREFEQPMREALEMAATLGQEVLSAEWHQSVDDPQGFFGDRFPGGRRVRGRLVERLLEERLATGNAERWAFVHAMLKEALERSAREHSRWEAHNLAAATMLLARHPDRMTMPAERLGRHLLHAGQTEAAIAPLLGGIEQRLISAGPGPALSLLDLTSRAMIAMGLPETDTRWGRVWTLSARVHLARGSADVAERFNQQALRESRRHGWARVGLYALHGEARRFLTTGELDRADSTLAELLAAARKAGDTVQVGRAHLGYGRLALRRGEARAAIGHLEHAIDTLGKDVVSVAEARLELARAVAADSAVPEPAVTAYELALNELSSLGLGRTVAEASRELGTLLQTAGRQERSRVLLEAAAERFDNLGSSADAAECRLRLCMLPGAPPLEALREDLRLLDHADRVDASVALAIAEYAYTLDWAAIGRVVAERSSPWTHPWSQALIRVAAAAAGVADQSELETALLRRVS